MRSLPIEPASSPCSTCSVTTTDPVIEDIDQFYAAQKRLVWSLLEALDVTVSPALRLRIEDNVPTRSLLAILAYARGLELEDRGLRGDARKAFARAAGIDSEMRAAVDGLERLGLDDDIDEGQVMDPSDLARRGWEPRSRRGRTGGEPARRELADDGGVDRGGAESTAAGAIGAPAADSRSGFLPSGSGAIGSRLGRSLAGAQTGQASQGGNDTREPSTDSQTDGIGGGGGVTVDFDVDIPGQP